MRKLLLFVCMLAGTAYPEIGHAQIARYRTQAGIPAACSPPFLTIDTTNNTFYFFGADGLCHAGGGTVPATGITFTANAGSITHSTGYGISANSDTSKMEYAENGVTFGFLNYHSLLSTWHSDTAIVSPSRGDIIYRNSAGLWTNLALGASGIYKKSNGTDLVNSTLPAAGTGACTGTQIVSGLNADGAPTCNSVPPSTITFEINGAGAAITTGEASAVTLQSSCTLTGYTILGGTADTATFKMWKNASATAIPTIADVINTSGVAISSGTKVTSTTLSDFTDTTWTAGDNVIASLTAVGGVTKYAKIQLYCQI